MPTPSYPSHHTSQPYLPGTSVVVNMVVIAIKENLNKIIGLLRHKNNCLFYCYSGSRNVRSLGSFLKKKKIDLRVSHNIFHSLNIF